MVFALLVLGSLMLTYLYCRVQNVGNLGPDRQHHVDVQKDTAANGVTMFSTGVSMAAGAPVSTPAPAPKPGFAMSEGVPTQPAGGQQP